MRLSDPRLPSGPSVQHMALNSDPIHLIDQKSRITLKLEQVLKSSSPYQMANRRFGHNNKIWLGNETSFGTYDIALHCLRQYSVPVTGSSGGPISGTSFWDRLLAAR